MKIPPLLIGASIIFWGLCCDLSTIAIPMASIVEARMILKSRFELGAKEFIRISDISSFFVIITLLYSYLNFETREMLLAFARYLPISFFLLLSAQLFSTSDKVIIGTGFGFSKKSYTHKPMDIRLPYIGLTLFSAAVGNQDESLFIPGTFIILGALLFANRSNRYRLASFIFLILITGSLGFGGKLAMRGAHEGVRDYMMEMYRLYMQRYSSDPFKSFTAIGDLGTLKLSGKIVLHVKRPFGGLIRIRDGVYDTLAGTSWYNRRRDKRNIFPSEEMSWQLHPDEQNFRTVQIFAELPERKGILPYMRGSFRADELNILSIESDGGENFRISEGPELINYKLHYADRDYSSPPAERDLKVPEEEKETFEKVKKLLPEGLKMDVEKFLAVENFFKKDFKYTLNTEGRGMYRSPLENFLLGRKAGHCEYYATATVLLLRTIGIPARYVTGFGVHEYSPIEENYVVRERDGHAWAIAWVDGKWKVIDTTPGVWLDEDRNEASIFEPIRDLFSFLRLRYALFRQQKRTDYNNYLFIAAAILTLFLTARIYRRKRRKPSESPVETFEIKRKSSPFDKIEKLLISKGFEKEQGETPARWIARIDKIRKDSQEDLPPILTEEMEEMLSLHYRHIYDTQPLNDEEMNMFEKKCRKIHADSDELPFQL